jgi:nanoRNase/pAp phosphatase (c-di-AMP/oligoRNAs hydrolase)
MLPKADIDRALELMKGAKRLVCVCHRNPDGDALGSLSGMAQLLEDNLAPIQTVLVCVDPAPPTFQFLPLASRIVHDPAPREGDVFIFLDSAEPKLTELHEKHT